MYPSGCLQHCTRYVTKIYLISNQVCSDTWGATWAESKPWKRNTTRCDSINIPNCQLLQIRDIPYRSTCSVYGGAWLCGAAVTHPGADVVFRNFNWTLVPRQHSPSVSYQTPVCPAAQQLPLTAASFLSLHSPSHPFLLFFPQVRTSVGARPPGDMGQTEGFWWLSPHPTGLRWLQNWHGRPCARLRVKERGNK